MTIPSELPQFVAATRSGPLQALALQSGQVVDARIIGTAPNGGTQVEIRGQMLNLVLPTAVKAGEIIKLEVQGAGQQMRLALQVATTASLPASPAPAPLPPQANMPLPNQNAALPAPLPGGAVVARPLVIAQPAPSMSAGQAIAQPMPASGQPQSSSAASIPVPPNSQLTPATAAATPVPAPTPTAVPPGPVIAQPVGIPVAPVATSLQTTVVVPPAASVYPQAASPGLPNPLAAAAAATATVPAAPAVPAAIAGATRPVTPLAGVANATAHSTPGNTLPQPPPAQPATPQAALAQMVQASVPRQGSVTALTTALTNIAGKVMLPEPVARAAQQVLAGRVAIDAPRFDGSALQTAVRSSGVFQEAGLARGQPLLQQPDLKSALLALRQTLTTWLGQQAPVAAVAQIPPPLRGTTPRARASEPPPPLDAEAVPEEVGKHLLERTESALARVRLHQHASLPDPTGRTAEWSMDLPVLVGTQQTLMQLQIHRDQHNESETGGERGWQMRFALNLPEMGEVGAQVSLRSRSVGVMLWATDAATSAALDEKIVALRESLATAGLHPGAVIVRHGEPPAPPTAPSGHFVDART